MSSYMLHLEYKRCGGCPSVPNAVTLATEDCKRRLSTPRSA